MKFGIEFVPYKPIDEIVELSKKAEEVGIEYCWVTDHYNNRNIYVTLAAIAKGTKKIMLGPGATNPYLIHPSVTASSIASIDEISGGRAVLGIAAGDRTLLSSLGVEVRNPLKVMGESIQIIRELLSGKKVDFNGEIFKLKSARLNFKPKHEIPIYIGAQGPKLLQLAGRISNGVLINASNPLDLGHAATEIISGREKDGKKLEGIDIAAYTCFSVADSHEKAEAAARPIVAFIISSTQEAILKRHEISAGEAFRVREALGAGRLKEAMASITKRMLDAFCVYGTPTDCIKQISEISKVGVTQFVMGSPIGPDPVASIEIVRREIMPHFK